MKNKIAYNEMIDLLKRSIHTAPSSGWKAISQQLDLTQELENLPQYQAPDHLWGEIEDTLDHGDTPSSVEKSYKNHLRWAVVIIAMLLGVIAYLLVPQSDDDAYEYRSETEQFAFNEEVIQLDDDLSDVYMFLRENESVFTENQIEKFELYISELKSAIKEIKEIKEKYGQDESVNILIARIERDKAHLLKEIITAST